MHSCLQENAGRVKGPSPERHNKSHLVNEQHWWQATKLSDFHHCVSVCHSFFGTNASVRSLQYCNKLFVNMSLILLNCACKYTMPVHCIIIGNWKFPQNMMKMRWIFGSYIHISSEEYLCLLVALWRNNLRDLPWSVCALKLDDPLGLCLLRNISSY